MKKIFGLYALLIAVGLISFSVGTEASNQDSFWAEAAQGGMAEIMMAQTALQKTQNEEVRAYAQKMIDDHTAANDELKSLAASKNVTLPTEVSAKHKAMMEKMMSLSGMDFDREYVKSQVKDHEKMVKLFQRQSERDTDAEVKAFAAKTLPTLRMHLEMAQTLNGKMKNMNRGGNRNSGDDDRNTNSNRGNSNMENMNSNSNRNNNSNRNSNSNSNTNSNSNDNRK